MCVEIRWGRFSLFLSSSASERRTRNVRKAGRRTRIPAGGESSEHTQHPFLAAAAAAAAAAARSDRTGPETRRARASIAGAVAWRAPFLGPLSATLSRSLMLGRAGVPRRSYPRAGTCSPRNRDRRFFFFSFYFFFFLEEGWEGR